MAEQTSTVPPSWHTENVARTVLLEVRPDTHSDVPAGCAYLEASHVDHGPVEIWLHRRQVLEAITALARIAGCEVIEQWREVFPKGSVAWHGGPLDPALAMREGYKVERRFVITTPAQEVTIHG